MTFLLVLLKLIEGYKTYASTILIVLAGLGLILVEGYSETAARVCLTVLLLAIAAALASLRSAIAKIETEITSGR